MIEISQLRKLFKGPEIISHKYFDQLTDDLITRAHHPLAKLKKESYNLIPSAVLVPIIYEEDNVKILLTKRPTNLKDHAGQISFPGGKIETGDLTPIETSLREASEEVGLSREQVEVLGNLDVYVTGTGFRILPIVSVIKDHSSLKINKSEVDEVFYLPLEFLMNKNNHQEESATYSHDNEKYDYVYSVLPYENYRIWGATAGMLINLYQILK